MANFGPTGFGYTLDSVTNADPPAIDAADVALPRITKFSGIDEEGQVTDLTAFGDDIMSEGAIGLSKFARIVIGGYADISDSNSAFNVIGRPARNAAYPARTFTVEYEDGVSEAIEIFPVKNKLVPGVANLTMFEAVLAIAARARADHVETGF